MPSEVVVLRSELAVLHKENLRLKEFCKSMLAVCGQVITSQAEAIKMEKERADRVQEEVNGLKKRMNIQESWNGRPSESKEHVKNRTEFRKQVEAHEAYKKNEKDKDKTGEEKDKEKTGDDCTAPQPASKKTVGGQKGHKGVSRNDKCEKTLYFAPEMCRCCGRTDLYHAKRVNKRVFEFGNNGHPHCYMYVIYHAVCRGCGAVTIPHTGAIAGSSFLTKERAAVRTYYEQGSSVKSEKVYLADIHGMSVSAGAVSNCHTAMASEINADVICMPQEEPIVISKDDARLWRSPLKPCCGDGLAVADDDSDDEDVSAYDRNDALIASYSTVWTSSAVQPPAVRIMDVASMDPYVIPDESPHQVGGQNVQALVAVTSHTVQIKIVEHKYAEIVQKFLAWAIYRLITRDGFPGYGWHRAPHQRCHVHVLRKVEDPAIDTSVDSDQYIRYMLMREIYHEAKQAAAEITEAAGGPMRSACDLDLVKRKGLSEQVDAETARLTDKLYMAADIIDDKAATTMKNAAPYMFTALGYAGAPLQTNEVERSIRSNIVVNSRKSKGPFPNWKAAENFSALQTFSATCRKNGVSPYEATLKMAQDQNWDIFTRGIPPPIMARAKRPA